LSSHCSTGTSSFQRSPIYRPLLLVPASRP
jgi:hypothetical protein